jgi:hypothetical protein
VTIADAAEMASWGADVRVSASAIYDGNDPASNLRRLLEQRPPAARPGRPVPATPLNPVAS